MRLTTLYSKYFQKSKIFLYPLLEIKRGSIVPTETYLSWGDSYGAEDMKLVCIYKPEDTDKYNNFEKTVLLKHTRLSDYVKVDSEHTIFTFDFSDYENEWKHFITGKYSKIDDSVKRKILNYFEKHSGNHVYVESYLYPEKYVAKYAELLNVPVELLISVGELCDKPDLEKEKLLIEVADLENLKILD
tara:strand:- start:4872 stop:5435 length:564 start_codon:yes stop_codon:yes gene_type:complete